MALHPVPFSPTQVQLLGAGGGGGATWADSQSWTLEVIAVSFFSRFKLFSSMFVFHPISPLGSEFLEGKDSVSAFFPTHLQLPVSVLSAQ